jgi:hypothetical protein
MECALLQPHGGMLCEALRPSNAFQTISGVMKVKEKEVNVFAGWGLYRVPERYGRERGWIDDVGQKPMTVKM